MPKLAAHGSRGFDNGWYAFRYRWHNFNYKLLKCFFYLFLSLSLTLSLISLYSSLFVSSLSPSVAYTDTPVANNATARLSVQSVELPSVSSSDETPDESLWSGTTLAVCLAFRGGAGGGGLPGGRGGGFG